MRAELGERKLDRLGTITLHSQATRCVVMATRHDLHAELVEKALRAGKDVFVEKPLCLTPEELAAIERCLAELGPKAPLLMVGYNRRFARATSALRAHFTGVAPLMIHHRFSTATLPPAAWPQ